MMRDDLNYEIAALIKLGQALSYYAKIESDTLGPNVDYRRLLGKYLVLQQSAAEINLQLHRIGKLIAARLTDGQPMAIPVFFERSSGVLEADNIPQTALEEMPTE